MTPVRCLCIYLSFVLAYLSDPGMRQSTEEDTVNNPLSSTLALSNITAYNMATDEAIQINAPNAQVHVTSKLEMFHVLLLSLID